MAGEAAGATPAERAATTRAFMAVAEQEALAEGRDLEYELAALTPGAALDAEGEALEQGVAVIRTGWERLDRAIGGGFAIPSLNVLGAAPKSGKSLFGQIIATRHVEAGGAAYILDLENGRRRFLRRLLCRLSGLGPKEVAAAFRDRLSSLDAVHRWNAAKERLRRELRMLFVEFRPPGDMAARLAEVRAVAGDRPLLVVVDSLQKLPGDLSDRRATIDGWVRLFERLRLDLDAAFLVISEIKRNPKGEYVAHEAAFKESGGIEYAADLAMTLERPRADQDEEPVSTLSVQLSRDCDEDPRGVIASYVPVRPCYGIEERDPVASRPGNRRAPAGKADAAGDWLAALLADGPVRAGDVISQGERAGHTRATLYRVRKALDVQECTLNLKTAWRLP